MNAASACGNEIRRFKVAIDAACPLRCGYCFIDKDSGQELSWEQARRALDFALGSPGRRKELLIYGGEPMRRFPLLRRMVERARRVEASRGLSVTVAVATSGLLLREAQLAFLRSAGVRVSISLDGEPETHDRFRGSAAGAGSYAAAARGAARLLEALPNASLSALVAAHPQTGGGIDRALAHVAALGFGAFNVEVIRGVPWSAAQVAAFDAALGRAAGAIVRSSARGRFLFLESSFRELAEERPPAGAPVCPFRAHFEVFPGGEYSFYPYPLLRGDERPRALIGSVEEGPRGRFASCSYDPASADCGRCSGRYYTIERLRQGEDASAVRERRSRELAQRLRSALSGPAWARYRREAARRQR